MARLLNKKVIFAIALLLSAFTRLQAQEDESVYNPKDYKDPEQFEKFRKRRIIISAWQINQLKTGALVVRLKTNQKLIDALKKQGNEKMALETEMKQFAIDRNMIRAYTAQFTFCKVYFIYSNSSDSLLRGVRAGIFLDSTLTVNPAITMPEKFYLLAERDYAYNSSIGFVREDSARYVNEAGNPVKEVAVVAKNKYGHQLKAPFPYYVKDKTYAGPSADVRERIVFKGVPKFVMIGKQFSQEKLDQYIGIFNENLTQYHQATPAPDLGRIDPAILPFLY